MAVKAKEPDSVPAVQTGAPVSIEALAIAHKTPASVLAGVCAANGWKPGKAVEEQEYLAAVDAFLKGPMRGGSGKRGS